MSGMIIERIRERIKNSGESLNEISRNTGVDVAVLSRIMHGGDCKTLTADSLLSYFGLTIAQKNRSKRKRR
jgi:transcriptional regulator with XRE-family HTH domain